MQNNTTPERMKLWIYWKFWNYPDESWVTLEYLECLQLFTLHRPSEWKHVWRCSLVSCVQCLQYRPTVWSWKYQEKTDKLVSETRWQTRQSRYFITSFNSDWSFNLLDFIWETVFIWAAASYLRLLWFSFWSSSTTFVFRRRHEWKRSSELMVMMCLCCY